MSLTPEQRFVADARQKLGLSASGLAELLGLSNPGNNGATSVRNWEDGKRNPSGPVLIAVEALLTGWRPAGDDR